MTSADVRLRAAWSRSAAAALAMAVLVSGCAQQDDTASPVPPTSGGSLSGASAVRSGSGIVPPPPRTFDATLSGRQLPDARRPTRLRVPELGLDEPVVAVGVAADGQMDVPEQAASVSWYRFGPAPGDAGAAVLAGHVDFAGKRGVFWRLDELREGQRITVTVDAEELVFRVENIERYAKDELPVDELFVAGGRSQLLLVTCGGSFDDARRAYRDNVVVRAVPVGA